MPTKIDHVCLLVSDLDRAKNYYERLFDARCWRREDAPNMMVFEAQNIHFFLSASAATVDFLSKQHLSFQVSDLEDVISKLEEFGISEYKTGVIDLFEHANYRWCEWRDPDGIRLECVELI